MGVIGGILNLNSNEISVFYLRKKRSYRCRGYKYLRKAIHTKKNLSKKVHHRTLGEVHSLCAQKYSSRLLMYYRRRWCPSKTCHRFLQTQSFFSLGECFFNKNCRK